MNHPATSHDTKSTWNQFSEWVYCVAVVTFDLEVGQALEVFFVCSDRPIDSMLLQTFLFSFPILIT